MHSGWLQQFSVNGVCWSGEGRAAAVVGHIQLAQQNQLTVAIADLQTVCLLCGVLSQDHLQAFASWAYMCSALC